MRSPARLVALAVSLALHTFALLAHADDRPYLRVGTSGDYAPFSRAGQGFDIDVATLLARDLGYRTQWVSFTWPNLTRDVGRNAFDIVMSGVTWRPHRAVLGRLSRAVASGGPCLLGVRPAGAVAVNRGGVLEAYARQRFDSRSIVAVDDNTSLPGLLAAGRVDAIVTDSFELPHFTRPPWTASCEPPTDRKVYWIAPARASRLGPRVDRWIRDNEPTLQTLRRKWLGRASPRTARDHLVDLLARRLALMPAVAAHKRVHGIPIEDRSREARVLESARTRARERGIRLDGLDGLFRVQIELAKAVQRRTPRSEQALDLAEGRAALLVLGDRILDALAAVDASRPWTVDDLALLGAQLRPTEIGALRDALARVRPPPS